MQVHQVEMEGVVRGIQADMTKLSKSHSHTSNSVSKLLDKSRKLSVTMKEVRGHACRSPVAHPSLTCRSPQLSLTSRLVLRCGTRWSVRASR